MPPAEPAPYRLTPRALADLEDIWQHGARTWSVAQADRYVDSLLSIFHMIAAFPVLARERTNSRRPSAPPPQCPLPGGRQDRQPILNAVGR